MDDDQSNRISPLARPESASPADRVKQIQDLQRSSEALPAGGPRATEAGAADPTGTGFQAASVQRLGTELGAGRPTGKEQAVYARAQVDPAQLFGGGNQPEVMGNPWKVIDFGPMLPAVFSVPLEEYEAKVPEKAVKTPHGLLFKVALQPRNHKLPVLRRAVLTRTDGELRGAECLDPAELEALLVKAPSLGQAVFTRAFGAADQHPRVEGVGSAPDGGFDVSVSRNGETRSVPVNNFGQALQKGVTPDRAHVDVASYWLDRFEAAA